MVAMPTSKESALDMIRTGAALTIAFLSASAALAHHSVVVNFDTSKAVDVTGVIKEVKIRNPHSQIILEVTNPDGSVKEWFVEWNDRNAMIRRKVPLERLKVGDKITVNVNPNRTEDNVGYFRTATLPDGFVLRDCGFGAFRDAVANATEITC
jgi:hypothetical protein